MKRFLTAILAATLTASAWCAAPPVTTDVPRFIQAPTDKATFRRFTMDNGMKVLLVSDPKYNKSGASLAVHTGQIDDPRDTEGLAHFLEHMLFLGTEKYPSITDYGNFIRSNGGYNNAYTSSDHTNYQFEVRHDALPGALDRFAQFFIAPTFNAEFVGREVSAVNNEAMRHVQNDFRRQIGVLREMYDQNSGESKFSTGNKATLAKADPKAVRAFYESHYSADRMALAIAGKASLDDLEKLAREAFSSVLKRDLPPLVREATFLPNKESLRMATMEPIKEVQKLSLEFLVPATRPDFKGKSDQLLTQLLAYPGEGGLVTVLKRGGLINGLTAYVWERTQNYGSLMVDIELTPQGLQAHQKVLQSVFSYLEFLRSTTYPKDFFADRARIAQLQETFSDRGEGAALVTKLANQALFYPLDVAERATDVWGQPDEASYRSLLGALLPSRMLVTLVAKGLPVDRKERIYETGYAVTEDSGVAYEALIKPAKMAGFALPKPNRFMPSTTALLPERPMALINEPGLQLFYAQDTEFQRPSTTLIMRFVPVRETATADNMAKLRLLDMTLSDALSASLGDAELAGVEFKTELSTEGYKVTVTGFGDSPARFAQYFAQQLRAYTPSPQRFDAVKELALRSIKSYAQTEAYQLARDRRDAMTREFFFLPSEQQGASESATFAKVQDFASRYFAKGRLEMLIHGNLSAQDAIAVTREIAAKMATKTAPAQSLVRRRHLEILGNENVLDAGPIAGVNSALIMDYQLNDETPATRAAALVLGSFFDQPFYSELRTKQQLGYIVGSASTASLRKRFFTFIVQSSEYGPVELRKRAEAFISTLPAALQAVTDAQWDTLIAGARSNLEQKPKSILEKAELMFASAYDFDGEWDRRQAALLALDSLTKEQAIALLTQTLAGSDQKRRTMMLHATKHAEGNATSATFANRTKWKLTRKFL
jgi:secreted Zn-dependent insulinase-like peptidase